MTYDRNDNGNRSYNDFYWLLKTVRFVHVGWFIFSDSVNVKYKPRESFTLFLTFFVKYAKFKNN